MVYNTILGLVGLVCAIWVIYDLFAKQKAMTTGKKVVWLIFALLFSIITAIVYYFVVKKK
ncbi:hypothetical protein HOG16_02830 [Candidatus Woesearchaeota archaeon]|jgi:hypothetical protein|nr:hypothetical protein [Candidatus Woesearchaeota archaeon]MBT4322031.1 hypothetical protein [Candidatus Woesearchaeota archaeon]MBT4630777.1 hypothetical protein [Candidatus Woesearchaeota archaeon]